MIEVRTPAAPVETVTPIKPSEALRLGRLIRPVEAEGYLFQDGIEACAVGAMALGYGYDGPTDNYRECGERGEAAYALVEARTGISAARIFTINDAAIEEGQSGDAAVLAYLESRGL